MKHYVCPRCDALLDAEPIREAGERFDAYRCGGCSGRFFETGDLARIDDIHAPTLVEIRRLPSAAAQQEPLRCPACADRPVMTKAEHQRDRNVIVDICPACQGTWLDKGELSAIQTESLVTFVAGTVRWLASLRGRDAT